MPSSIDVARVSAFADNYIWLLHDDASGETVVVDPGEAEGVLRKAEARGWAISQIWITHWHPDHTGGIAAIKAATGAVVTGPAAEAAKIPALDRLVEDGDTVRIGALEARVMATPAHTAGHISYHLPDAALLFPGDTVFAMGCGRLFEGTAAQMHDALQRYAALPDDTAIFCAHEYTLANARFAAAAEPENPEVSERLGRIERARATGEATVPTTVACERATNPFMRASSAEALAALRQRKDAFAG